MEEKHTKEIKDLTQEHKEYIDGLEERQNIWIQSLEEKHQKAVKLYMAGIEKLQQELDEIKGKNTTSSL